MKRKVIASLLILMLTVLLASCSATDILPLTDTTTLTGQVFSSDGNTENSRNEAPDAGTTPVTTSDKSETDSAEPEQASDEKTSAESQPTIKPQEPDETVKDPNSRNEVTVNSSDASTTDSDRTPSTEKPTEKENPSVSPDDEATPPKKQPQAGSQTPPDPSPEPDKSDSNDPKTTEPNPPAIEPPATEPNPPEPPFSESPVDQSPVTNPPEDDTSGNSEESSTTSPSKELTQADFDRIVSEVSAYAESYEKKGFQFFWNEDMEFSWEVGWYGAAIVKNEGIDGTIEMLKLHVDRIVKATTDPRNGVTSPIMTYKVVQIDIGGEIAFAVIYGG